MTEPKTDAAHRNTVEQMVGRTFTPSHREEIISALWIIAALLAWNGGIRWLAWILFVKGVTDTLTSIGLALMELRKKANDTAHRQDRSASGGPVR